ncbi:uncharacterized protein LOC117102393 [Anneissia japonica]|uniref:uncharacterized protein LOC117102393 n=1 Tax=Anneissia japonica TaxID=1529436 RepID=UPI001425A8EF|nr:uncharacterized protein LOC117102393 [Anneissia japonica]
MPINLQTLFKPDNAEHLENAKKEAVSKLDVTNEQIKQFIDRTAAQGDSPIWHEMRLGRITASKVHSVLHTNTENPAKSVLQGICSPMGNLASIPAIQWGRKHGDTAAKHYENFVQNHHMDSSISKTGLWISQEHLFIAASPDALVSCRCCGSGVVEIKCPYKHKENETEAILGDKAGCLEVTDGKPTLNPFSPISALSAL